MSYWQRALIGTMCGRCNGVIAKGAPMRCLEIANVKRALKRCEQCADEPAPTTFPEVPMRTPVVFNAPSGMASVGAMAKAHRVDWKVRQSGEREPGQDG